MSGQSVSLAVQQLLTTTPTKCLSLSICPATVNFILFYIMRIFLAAIVVIIGANIGINAINAVSNIQDERQQRLCKQLPAGAGYDEMCNKYR